MLVVAAGVLLTSLVQGTNYGWGLAWQNELNHPKATLAQFIEAEILHGQYCPVTDKHPASGMWTLQFNDVPNFVELDFSHISIDIFEPCKSLIISVHSNKHDLHHNADNKNQPGVKV